MKTGFSGTFVISWSQTEIDGLEVAPVKTLEVGATWGWRGDAIRVDGPTSVLRLDQANDAENLRKRAASKVQRLVGAAMDGTNVVRPQTLRNATDPLLGGSFVVTDGDQSYAVSMIDIGGSNQPLLMFLDEIPPRDRELWVVSHTLGNERQSEQDDDRVICFTPGTQILTPNGSTGVEDLREGDFIQTKDNGVQPLRWIGSRRITGARLMAMPHLRPVRLTRGALGSDEPDMDLLVSPEHQIIVKGAVAQALFNTSEVLVSAKDLVNGGSVFVDHSVRDVRYIHMLFDHHQVIWANGVETESFHPASAALSALDGRDRARLLMVHPDLALDPHTYGGFARRTLSRSEAAILSHAA